MALGERFTSTPELGLGLTDAGRELSLGWRLVRERRSGDIGALELALEGRRRDAVNDNTGVAPEHIVGLRVTVRW